MALAAGVNGSAWKLAALRSQAPPAAGTVARRGGYGGREAAELEGGHQTHHPRLQRRRAEAVEPAATLTKCDLVDDDWLELVRDEVTERLRPTTMRPFWRDWRRWRAAIQRRWCSWRWPSMFVEVIPIRYVGAVFSAKLR